MHPVFLGAAVVTAAAALAMDAARRDRGMERPGVAAFLIGLPLSPLVDQYVKSPLTALVQRLTWPGQAGPPPLTFFLLVLWIAPLVEEGTKLLPLAMPEIAASLRRPAASIELGMASGLGFGVGEAWYLALVIASARSGASLGRVEAALTSGLVAYLTERAVVCFAHSVMTSVAMTGVARGALAGASGYLGAVALHALVNVSALLAWTGIGGPLAPDLALLVAIVALSVVFEKLESDQRDHLASGRK